MMCCCVLDDALHNTPHACQRPGLFFPAKELKALRRSAVDALMQSVLHCNTADGALLLEHMCGRLPCMTPTRMPRAQA